MTNSVAPDATDVPLYVLSEAIAKQKFLAFQRSREQLSARRRINQAAVAMTTSMEVPLSSAPTDAVLPGASSALRSRDVGYRSPPSPPGSRGRSGSATPAEREDRTAVAVTSASPPSETKAVFELTEMVLRLQTALALAKKENVQLRLKSGAGTSPLSGRRFASRGTQTGNTVSFAADMLISRSGLGSPSPSDPHAQYADPLDELLDTRRCKKLEKMLVHRTIEANAARDDQERAEQEVHQLRALSQERESVTERLRAERDAARAQCLALQDALTVAERERDMAKQLAKGESAVRLELAQSRSSLEAKEAEVLELHGLCDYLHHQSEQRRILLDMGDVVSDESRGRAAMVTEFVRGVDSLLRLREASDRSRLVRIEIRVDEGQEM